MFHNKYPIILFFFCFSFYNFYALSRKYKKQEDELFAELKRDGPWPNEEAVDILPPKKPDFYPFGSVKKNSLLLVTDFGVFEARQRSEERIHFSGKQADYSKKFLNKYTNIWQNIEQSDINSKTHFVNDLIKDLSNAQPYNLIIDNVYDWCAPIVWENALQTKELHKAKFAILCVENAILTFYGDVNQFGMDKRLKETLKDWKIKLYQLSRESYWTAS